MSCRGRTAVTHRPRRPRGRRRTRAVGLRIRYHEAPGGLVASWRVDRLLELRRPALTIVLGAFAIVLGLVFAGALERLPLSGQSRRINYRPLLAGPASAHATLLFATPAADGSVPDTPDRLALVFNEPVSTAGTPVRLTGTEGQRITVGSAELPRGRTVTPIRVSEHRR